MNHIDMRTELLCFVFSDAVCSAVMACMWQSNRKRFPGLGLWLAGFVMQFVAVVLFAVRGIVPVSVANLLGDTLVVAGTLLFYRGLQRYTGQTRPLWRAYLLLTVYTIVQANFMWVQPMLRVRVVALSLALGAICAQCAWLILSRGTTKRQPAAKAAGAILGAFSLFSVARALVNIAVPSTEDLFAAGAQEVLLIMAYQVLLVGLAFSLFLAVNQRLIAALELDIGQRRQVEQALRESEEKFALAFQTSPIGIAITRIKDSRFVEVNEAFCSITGFTREEVANRTPADFSLWVDEKRRSGVLSRILSGQKVVGEEFEFRKKNGQIATALFSADVLVLKNEKFMLSGAADITERKRMEEAIRVNAEKLARSNAELESFAYVVSHDLQEPLRMVASFAQLLSTRYFGKLDDTADRYIRYAVDGAKRMQQLINDLLAYSRVNTKDLDPRPTECEAVVRATLENLTASIEESGAVVDWGALPVLMADPVQLGQLFQNLIGNAIKFRGQAPPHVRISAADDGANWLFSVQDNGIGIEQRHADLIFQIFQRLHTGEEYPGTGIGLAICKKVVERHGGTIWVESEPGAGSTFRFSLPISQEMVTSGATDEQSEETSGDTCGRGQPRRC